MTQDSGARLPDALADEVAALQAQHRLVAEVLQRYQQGLEHLGSVKERAQRLQWLTSGTLGLEDLPLSEDLHQNLYSLELIFRPSFDWIVRHFRIAGGREAAFTYLDALVSEEKVGHLVLKPLMFEAFPIRNGAGIQEVRQILLQHALVASGVREVHSLQEVVEGVLLGEGALLIDGCNTAILVSVQGHQARSVEEPMSEAVIRGPREGFVETLRTNLSLLRRRVRSPYLKVETLSIGALTRTSVAVAYIAGLASDKMVAEVRERLSQIEIDGVLESGYLEELIEDDPLSPFPQILNTERPDVVAANLLEGRIAILTDGTPFVLVVPATLWDMLQSSEDYYSRWYIGTAIRGLRWIFVFIALFLPSIYVAITTFHQEMLPTSLLLTIARSREGIPFPSLVEALLMEIAFEILREAGVRLPKPVGQAISIVGALVIGEAATRAGLVSNAMVIVVASTGVASFAIPRFNLGISIRLLRFPLILLAGMLGLYGIMLGFLTILVHLSGLRSFGIPYLWPVTPVNLQELKDTIVRLPIWAMPYRPGLFNKRNPRRMPQPTKPGPELWEENIRQPEPPRED